MKKRVIVTAIVLFLLACLALSAIAALPAAEEPVSQAYDMDLFKQILDSGLLEQTAEAVRGITGDLNVSY